MMTTYKQKNMREIVQTNDRYMCFFTGFAFKKLFGTETNKDLLISFLNALLDGMETIKDIVYLPDEQFRHFLEGSPSVFDVCCENEKGDKILIEVQKANEEYFKDKSIYYSSFPISEYSRQEGWHFEQKKAYAIGILNFTFDHKEDYISKVKISDTETKDAFHDKLTYIYIETPKFKKKESELATMLDKWLYAIINLDELSNIPQSFQEKIFKKLFKQADIANLNDMEIRGYNGSLRNYRDWYSILYTKKKEEGKMEAKALLEEGIDIKIISKVTELSITEIEQIKQTL